MITAVNKTKSRIEDLAKPHRLCRTIVVIPAKNEEAWLAAALDALRKQRDPDGKQLSHAEYEVILLLNNCTDHSVELVHNYAERFDSFQVHGLEYEFPPEEAHVGTARKVLMDLACDRLEMVADETKAILSTDADTVVAPDWIAQNLAEIEAGAEVVGGVIHLFPKDLASLDAPIQIAYKRDRELQQLVARLESLLDPDPNDPWPRHLEHFGASLACSPEVYRRSGGLPAVKPLEDVAFIDALRRVGARIRHAPAVQITTSARMDGRIEVGLSGQLRLWREEALQGQPQTVDSVAWLAHRFRTLRALRRLNEEFRGADIAVFPPNWQHRLRGCLSKRLLTPRFLEVLDCDRLIEDIFESKDGGSSRRSEITATLAGLRDLIKQLEASPED